MFETKTQEGFWRKADWTADNNVFVNLTAKAKSLFTPERFSKLSFPRSTSHTNHAYTIVSKQKEEILDRNMERNEGERRLIYIPSLS
mmetsp:Transcript_36850/g.44421  ORF Transcript_36850/g.44421 Transcript_36850/m.44421 type:complete len:87 (-) Transcript_36850:105-365(-)